MIKKILFLLVISLLAACAKEEYSSIQTESTANTFTLDLTKVPYSKLSDYRFFSGVLKDLNPENGVLPFAPASALFTNYAKKKRFIWMPKNTTATFATSDQSFDFPVGTVLIKSFYYENVQPSNSTMLIETRLLVKKENGFQAYVYVWNDAQSEAILDGEQQGVFKSITWLEKGREKSVDYKIPSQTECVTCHKTNGNASSAGLSPISTKPQNLNFTFQYENTAENQLIKWKSMGFLGNDIPTSINSTVNWEDNNQALESRARSYIDANCAHCHQQNGYCDYTPQRFNFSTTNVNTFGICLPTTNQQYGKYIFQPGNADKSAAINRMNSNLGSVKMPIIGRNIIHAEGVQLLTDYINSLQKNCN